MKKLIHYIKLIWQVTPSYVLLLAAKSVLTSVQLFTNVVFPKYLIEELMGGKAPERLFLWGALIVGSNVMITFVNNTIKKYLDVKSDIAFHQMNQVMAKKIMRLEYSYLENPYYLDLKERASFAVNNQGAAVWLIQNVADVVTGLVTLAGLLTIMATLGPVLILVLAAALAGMLLLYRCMSGAQVEFTQELIPINRRFGYYLNLGTDKSVQKDCRLYDMSEMFCSRMLRYTEESCDLFDRFSIQAGKCLGGMSFINDAAAAVCYLYVGLRTLGGRTGLTPISIGALTMYVSAALNFTTTMRRLGESVVQTMQALTYLEPYLEFMSIPEEEQVSGHEKLDGGVRTIEFRNVTFTYPGADTPVLQEVSFSLEQGEKISIVGLNGAGKSTLVKLLCRMYKVDSGEILINGRNIYDYDYDEYMSTVAAVFQDYRLFNYTIEENISCGRPGQPGDGDEVAGRGSAEAAGTAAEGTGDGVCAGVQELEAADSARELEKGSQEKVARLIREVGLQEKIHNLPKGIDSRLGKEYDEEGVELSGGESQKIAIARALYKGGSLVILDEPASALDPIAEAEIYEKFNSLVEDKTALYISHRMSSSVFCDRILIIDGGRVADFDTHENLMRKTDSLYYKLFQSQAENYQLG